MHGACGFSLNLSLKSGGLGEYSVECRYLNNNIMHYIVIIFYIMAKAVAIPTIPT